MIKSLLLSLIFTVGIISVNANDLSTTIVSSPFEQVSTTIPQDEIVTLNVFPNPTVDVINVVSVIEINSVKVINTIGQTVNVINGINDNSVVIDMNNFDNGIYFIVIDDLEIVKVIKK